jgi:beta-phosphoglucomutase-like phosphatase (HAD superfamily)
MMNRTGLGALFDRVISGGSVKNGKPAPDIFLKAAGLLGVEPADCVVIEDSRNGVIAAKSAGMKCVGYKNPNSGVQDLSCSDLVVDDMRKIDYNLLVSLSGGEYSGPAG